MLRSKIMYNMGLFNASKWKRPFAMLTDKYSEACLLFYFYCLILLLKAAFDNGRKDKYVPSGCCAILGHYEICVRQIMFYSPQIQFIFLFFMYCNKKIAFNCNFTVLRVCAALYLPYQMGFNSHLHVSTRFQET